MRFQRQYLSQNSIDDLNRNIRRNTSPDPGFSGNDFTYHKELSNTLKTTKSLWRQEIYENKYLIKSHGLLYWPRTEITLDKVDGGTRVTLKYKGVSVVYFFYALMISFALVFLLKATVGANAFTSASIGFVMCIFPLALVSLLLRKTQNNILKLIEAL